MIISIEGNIGSGKSTLLKILNQKLSENKGYTFIQEPVNEWLKITDSNGENILSKFYSNQEKYGFAFQIMAFTTKLQSIKNSVNNSNIIMTERSVYTDKEVFAKMLHMDNKIDDIMYKIYTNMFDTFIDEQINVKKIIYVKTSPSVCYDRVNKRKRQEENSIPLEYLRKCGEYHDDWLLKNNNVLVLNGNDEFENNDEIINGWLEKINLFCNK
jgi:deoxyadenosine/deoxycytidine kinase